MKFTNMKEAVAAQMALMANRVWYQTTVTKDELWGTYLGSFPEGTNPIFRERTEHDCTCCKQFIRAIGNMVTFADDGSLVSIWDIDVGGFYQVVADALSVKVKSYPIDTVYLHDQPKVGTDHNTEITETGAIEWNHFYAVLPGEVVKRKDKIATIQGLSRDQFNSLKRSVNEISQDAIDAVLDLIDDNNIYRGEEKRHTVQLLSDIKAAVIATGPKRADSLIWAKARGLGEESAIRNSVIGTLLVDLSEGLYLDNAVAKYEVKVAPANYKRSKSIVTRAMIERAERTVADLDIENALHRRHANLDDITINNLIYADRSVQEAKGVFSAMYGDVAKPVKVSDLVKAPIPEFGYEQFITEILPNTQKLEVLFDKAKTANLVSLVAPVNKYALPILAWDNNFSWSYNGNLTDSMRENVLKAGGKVDGALRFSIQWNDTLESLNDLDAHCVLPQGEHIYFSQPRNHRSGGNLDVDIRRPEGVAVENIIFPRLDTMSDGTYEFLVHNYADRGGRNWSAEIEFEGVIYSFEHKGITVNDSKTLVARVVKKGNTLSILEGGGMPHGETQVQAWGISTGEFQQVDGLMFSPNYWDENNQGNKHLFFMLRGCVNPDKVRGFYNEYLMPTLHEHRKVFEILAPQLLAPYSTDQLSGLGFSTTKRETVICRLDGKLVKIKF